MSTVIEGDTLMRVVALTAAPDFVDVYGNVTGTRNGTYKPTSVGERGYMLNSAAAPLDIGVELTGDQLAICFNWTPYEIDQAMSAATPFQLAAGKSQPAPGTNPLNKWPVGSLKHLLDSMKIAYPADATISDLVALVPDTHQHHLVKEVPVPTWTNLRIVQWLEKEGADVPDALKDDKDALSEMVHDLIELKAGIPLDPGFVTPLPKDQWPTPPNLDRTSHNQLAAWMSVSLYPTADAHSVRPLLEACTKAELAAMLEGTRPLPDTSHLPAANS